LPSDTTYLSIVGQGISGTIPTELGLATQLEVVTLFFNSISGTIPGEACAGPTFMLLDSNLISGTLPPEIVKLQQLAVQQNRLSGSIPNMASGRGPTLTHPLNGTASIGLTQLLLNGNSRLSGTLPPDLGQLTLVALQLAKNSISGTIPPEMFDMKVKDLGPLGLLELSQMPISGTIPPEIEKATNLNLLWLYQTSLSGTIPPELGNDPSPQARIWLHENSLSGTIPDELGKLYRLKDLLLHGNSLSGTIPPLKGLTRYIWPFHHKLEKCYLSSSQCHETSIYDCPTVADESNVFDCPHPSSLPPSCSKNLPACATWPASCAKATPQPPVSNLSPVVRKLTVYRTQAATWVSNITNSDVADIAGSSCYLEKFGHQIPKLYGDHPVFARYTLYVYEPNVTNGSYLNCPDQMPRICKNNSGDIEKVGMARCSPGGQPCDCSYNGTWFSLPAGNLSSPTPGGECRLDCKRDKRTGTCIGYSCNWQVAAIEKIASMACIQAHGCKLSPGGCPPATLEAAFDTCTDMCTPPVEKCDISETVVPSNDLSRIAFDPAECIACLQGGGAFTRVTSLTGWGANRTLSTWSCGQAGESKHGTLSITGSSADASSLCKCAYGDIEPPTPPPPCPGGSFNLCVSGCLQQPDACESVCNDSCCTLCPDDPQCQVGSAAAASKRMRVALSAHPSRATSSTVCPQ